MCLYGWPGRLKCLATCLDRSDLGMILCFLHHVDVRESGHLITVGSPMLELVAGHARGVTNDIRTCVLDMMNRRVLQRLLSI